MGKVQVIILAAGKGIRMKSEEPKTLAQLKGKAIIRHLIESVVGSGLIKKPVMVVGHKRDKIMAELGDECTYVIQEETLGTAHAVMCAREILEGKFENIITLYGDHPMVTSQTLKSLAEKHLKGANTITLATVRLHDFADWRIVFHNNFSRIIRDEDNKIVKSVEVRDTTEEEKKILEVNPGYYCFESNWLWNNLTKIKNNNVNKEYYIADLLGMAIEQGKKIESIEINPIEALGVNSKEELEMLEKLG